MDTLSCALLVALAIVVVAYFALHGKRPLAPVRPAGPSAPGALAPAYPILEAYCNVPQLKEESLGTLILEVQGVPPLSLAGCPARLHSAPGKVPLEGWNSPPLFVAEILPNATTVAGRGTATLLLRPVGNAVLQGDISLAGLPLGYVEIQPCH